jgi:GT2 family glycosyltransferase
MSLPKVSIVVTAYLEKSKPYLDACIESIKHLDYPQELLDVVIICPTWYAPMYEGCKTLHPCVGQYHNPIAVNYGFKVTDQSSKYVLMLNDDVILTRDCLKNMVMHTKDNDVILGAISNCDNHDFYTLEFPGNLGSRQLRFEQIKDKLNAMMSAKSAYPPGYIYPRTLYLYANLFPRKVLAKIGGFDEQFKTGFDDTDFCLRAVKSGVRLAIALDCLIWHCGGVSADQTMGSLDSELRAENERFFREKWGL